MTLGAVPQLTLAIATECMGPRCDERAVVRIELGDFNGAYCAACRPSRATISQLAALYGIEARVVDLT